MNTRWLVTWIVALAVTLGGWLGFETYWRTQGYKPTVMDSFDLWSQMRARASRAAPPERVALLGASRIQYGLAPAVFRDEAMKLGRDVDAIMLAVNGHYPLAALRDLSNDEAFKGIAIVGIDSRGFNPAWREMQQKYADYFHKEFSPARELHRRTLTYVQLQAIAARPDFAIITLAKRYSNGYGAPQKDYVTFTRDRAGATVYEGSNIQAIRDARINDLRSSYRDTLIPTPAQWLGANAEIVDWVKRINARGGKVVFYREPVSGEHLKLDEANFPREKMWDELAKIMPAAMIDFQDHPSLNIDTPDTSHIDAKDIDRHTRALVRVLRTKGIL